MVIQKILSQHLRKLWLTGLLALMTTICANAAITVHGTVLDQNGEPLIGATVRVDGGTQGTATDIDGNYVLSNVDDNATLVVTYVGYLDRKVKVNGHTEVNITLEENIEALEEVVVIGYGSLSKKEVSSSIVQVDRDQFQQGAMNNAMEMLTGKVAGLNVATAAAADPNGSSNLQIRGATSLSAGNEPLVVIDGVAGGDIRSIAPQDIESMTVLKDAASAAIYGTRGANGVILITTKKGSGTEGKVNVTYDGYLAANFAKDKPQVLSASEFRASRRSMDYGASTDWYNELLRKFSYDTNHYVGVDVTNSTGYFGGSLSYKRATGIDLTSAREDYGGRFALQQRVLDNILQINASLSARKVNEKWGNNGAFDSALQMNPTMPVYNEDGSFYQPTSPTGASNPVQSMIGNTSQGSRMYVLGTAELKWNIWHNEHHMFNTQVSYSYNYNDLRSDYYSPSTSSSSFWNGYAGTGNMKYQKWFSNTVEWLGNYALTLEDHELKVMLGYSYQRDSYEQMYMENSDFTFDQLLWWGIGNGSYLKDGKANMYAGKTESTLIGFFGRVNYGWKSMLFASASLRYEGSTKFGANHKWGSFPSVSVAWEMTKMPFLQNHYDVVQSLKPRISFGVTGRSDFSSYLSIPTYSGNGNYPFDGQWVNGYRPSNNPNPDLGWEKNMATNIGVDFMLWNRFYGSIEYFDRTSQDLLYNYTAPQPPYVYSNIMVNVGSIKNTGVEIALNAEAVVNQPVTWTTGINYAYGTTKLTKLSSDIYKATYLDLYQKPGVGSNDYFFRVEKGGSIGEFYGYKYAGTDESGNMLVYNANNEKIYATQAAPDTDKRYIGNGAPKHFLTWNNTLRWKNFDLSVMFNGAFGFQIFNMRKYGMGLRGAGSDNVLRDAYLKDKDLYSSAGVISDYFLENGDYFKLENITLGYTLPFNTKVLDSLRIYLTAKNLFTLTGYDGNDPSIVTSTGITPGVDVASAYPSATSLTLGVTFKFK